MLSIALSLTMFSGSLLGAAPAADEERLAELQSEILRRLKERIDELEADAAKDRERITDLEAQVAATPRAGPPPSTFEVSWRDGLRFETGDKNFRIDLGGMIQNDWAFMSQDDDMRDTFGGFDDGTEFRRARLRMSGLLYNVVDFKIEYDFATGSPKAADVYMGLTNIPVVPDIRIGHVKEPFSMEVLTKDSDGPFMERSLAVSALAPQRNVGAMAYESLLDDRLSGAAGVFHDTNDYGQGAGGGAYDVALRIAGVPLMDDAKNLLCIGAGYQYRNPSEDQLRFSTQPEAHLAPTVVDTGTFSAEDAHLVSVQALGVLGPAWFQFEGIEAFVQRATVEDPRFSGWSVSGGFFVTGERRPIRAGVFSRVRPKQTFLDGKGGIGALEIAARYSTVDLDSEGIEGGVARDATAGINWYLNWNVRVALNYVYSRVQDIGYANIVEMRFQIDL
jgi:phosphate-selective porin OprO and OprP